MRHPVLAVSTALCLLLPSGCSKDITRATAATIFSVDGRVVFGKADQNDFQSVTAKSRIESGDSVRALAGASVDLAFVPGVLAQLGSDSEVKIEELTITKDGNDTGGGMHDRTARVQLNRGRMSVLFTPSYRSTTQLVITSPQVTMRPDSDCSFSVWTDGAATRVTSVKGEVSVLVDTKPPVRIAAGYFQQWPATRSEPLIAADNRAAQIDITDSLEAEKRFQGEVSGWQKRGPF